MQELVQDEARYLELKQKYETTTQQKQEGFLQEKGENMKVGVHFEQNNGLASTQL